MLRCAVLRCAALRCPAWQPPQAAGPAVHLAAGWLLCAERPPPRYVAPSPACLAALFWRPAAPFRSQAPGSPSFIPRTTNQSLPHPLFPSLPFCFACSNLTLSLPTDRHWCFCCGLQAIAPLPLRGFALVQWASCFLSSRKKFDPITRHGGVPTAPILWHWNGMCLLAP